MSLQDFRAALDTMNAALADPYQPMSPAQIEAMVRHLTRTSLLPLLLLLPPPPPPPPPPPAAAAAGEHASPVSQAEALPLNEGGLIDFNRFMRAFEVYDTARYGPAPGAAPCAAPT
jgi:hypothetical protein